MITDLFLRRELHSCTNLIIPICDTDEEFNQLMSDAHKVQQATTKMLNGEISLWELMEAIEPFVPDIDDYCDEVEKNICQLME
ncbi:hypothetical protein [Scytonema sp. NUACC26]|uniref:hypothetical protein n=1 Tax=Scytonema sp. NUACC26 TaxID=3140176 RepID=UPI0034DC04B2